MTLAFAPYEPSTIGDHRRRNARGGLHTHTQEMPAFRQPGFIPGATRLFEALRNPEKRADEVLVELKAGPPSRKPSRQKRKFWKPSTWRKRFADAFAWFGLTMTYLCLVFVVAVTGLLMTRGLILIWEAWISELGK